MIIIGLKKEHGPSNLDRQLFQGVFGLIKCCLVASWLLTFIQTDAHANQKTQPIKDTLTIRLVENLAQLEKVALFGSCVPTVLPRATWNCVIDGNGQSEHQRYETCLEGSRIALSDEFKQIAQANSASQALKQLVEHKIGKDGLRSAINWFACQGIFVQMAARKSPARPNLGNLLTELKLTISTNRHLKADRVAEVAPWIAEAAKWDDLQSRTKILFFEITELPTSITITVEFTEAGIINELRVGISTK